MGEWVEYTWIGADLQPEKCVQMSRLIYEVFLHQTIAFTLRRSRKTPHLQSITEENINHHLKPVEVSAGFER